MDVRYPNSSIWICVEKCPHYQINDRVELKNFSLNYSSNLCSYEVEAGNYDSIDYANNTNYVNTNLGPCPVFPIYARWELIFLQTVKEKARNRFVSFQQTNFEPLRSERNR